MTVDVGMNTGWAYWDECESFPAPDIWGQYSVKPHKILEEDLTELAYQFDDNICALRSTPKIIILEGVELWAGNLRSLTSASRGNLFKLSYIVGMYARNALHYGSGFRIIPASQWKGQLKDPMVMKRVTNLTGIEFKKSEQHVCDAIGIGLSHMGLFENNIRRGGKTVKYKLQNR